MLSRVTLTSPIGPAVTTPGHFAAVSPTAVSPRLPSPFYACKPRACSQQPANRGFPIPGGLRAPDLPLRGPWCGAGPPRPRPGWGAQHGRLGSAPPALCR